MRFKRGEKIGTYTVQFQLKQGNYAETYRVKDENGKTRFLKLINLAKLNRHQINDSGKIVEVEIVRQLDHANLCKFIEEGSLVIDGGQYTYFVTEFISGETLDKKIIRDGTLSVYDAKKVGKAVLSALKYLHSLPKPVIHGEITIQNILINLTEDLSQLKLIDFGHARFLGQPPVKPTLNQVNPFYLAPERFSGISQVQSDLFSVGVVLYFVVFGRLPWFIDTSKVQGDVVDALLEERAEGLKIPAIDKYELDDQFVNTIAKALSLDVEDRFQTAEEFIQALDGEKRVGRQSFERKKVDERPESRAKKEMPSKVRKKKGNGFSDVAGMDELKKSMIEDIIEPIRNPEEYKRYGVSLPNGILLYGPPGCGKTFIAEKLAEELGCNFLPVNCSDIASPYIHGGQDKIAAMFKDARENAPVILFLDEIEAMIMNRSRHTNVSESGEVTVFLTELNNCSEDGIVVVGATNNPLSLDPAALRSGRFDRKYYVGPPDFDARVGLFKIYLKNRPVDFGIDYEELARMTENYVSADFKVLVNDASREALKKKEKITMAILKETISKSKPSLSAKTMKTFEEIRSQMQGDSKNNDRPRIGFKP